MISSKAFTVLPLLLGVIAWPTFAIDTSAEEKTCREIGFKPKTEKYANCVLELYERRGSQTASRPSNPRSVARSAAVGDGSQDDQTCQKYGLKPGQPEYGNCRMQIDMARQQVAREQAKYQAELVAYEKQKKEQDAQRRREQGLRQMAIGAGIASGQISLEDLGRSSLGLPPAPRAPDMQNQTIRLPNGSLVHCNTVGSITNCF